MNKVKLRNVISEFIVPMRDKPTSFDGLTPWCRIEDIEGKYISRSLSQQNVSDKIIKEMNLKVYPVGTLLFTCSASIGITAITKSRLCSNQTFIGLVPSESLDVEYLYYYLSKVGKSLSSAASITTIPYLSKRFFQDFEITLPDLFEQQKIASVLSALDDKIELNNKINAELEQMAKTLYDYWFVQFDFPNEEGKPYKSSGSKMVYNEVLKREIPEGWEIKNIEDICEIVDCLHSKKPNHVFENDKYYLLQLNNLLDNGLIDISKKYYVSKKDFEFWTSRIIIKEHDILFTNAGRVAQTTQVSKEIIAGIGRNITAVRPKNISPTFCYLSINGIDIQKQILNNIDQGAFFQSFNVKGIKLLNFIYPPTDIQKKFEKIVYQIRRKRELNLQQNQEFVSLRDWLLPMLMNGQVKVED